jgi:hypothetical protein
MGERLSIAPAACASKTAIATQVVAKPDLHDGGSPHLGRRMFSRLRKANGTFRTYRRNPEVIRVAPRSSVACMRS